MSHIFLLIGCAIPLWLSLAGLPRWGGDPWAGWEVDGRDLSMVSGEIGLTLRIWAPVTTSGATSAACSGGAGAAPAIGAGSGLALSTIPLALV